MGGEAFSPILDKRGKSLSGFSFSNWLEKNKIVFHRENCKSAWGWIKEILLLVNHICHRILLSIAQLSLIIMLVTVFMNVILRFCFNSGIKWAEEVPGLLVTLFTFLACAIGCRDHMHITVGIFYNRFKEGGKARKAMDILSDIAVLFCGVALFYYGLTYIIKLRPGSMPMTGWPTWLRYIPAPIGGFLMTFDQLLFLFGIVDRNDLLYSEAEVDYAKLVKENEAEAAKGGAK